MEILFSSKAPLHSLSPSSTTMSGLPTATVVLFQGEFQSQLAKWQYLSSKKFVEEGWYISTRKRLGRKSGVLGRVRERERHGPGERETPPL